MAQAPACVLINGANRGDRTHDLIITNDLLYQLSYVGLLPKKWHPLAESDRSSQDENLVS